MNKNFIYGLVINGAFHSNRMEVKTSKPNGIYSMDMSQDNFRATISPADIDEAVKFFRKASTIKVIRGISFHDGIIPENPVAYRSIPIKVNDATYDEFEEIEVACTKNSPYYFIRIISTQKAYPLLDVKEALENGGDINLIKGVTPEIRVAYTFYFLEKEREKLEKEKERLRKEMEEPTNFIKLVMKASGALVHSIKKINRGFEVVWSAAGHRINTLLGKDLRVIEAGFCTSGYDTTQSASSVAKLLKDYVDDGSHIHLTRTS